MSESKTNSRYDKFTRAEKYTIGIILLIEPITGNENAFGFDIGSNPARLAAAHKARDLGTVVITEPIVLTQDSDSTQKAFLMILHSAKKN